MIFLLRRLGWAAVTILGVMIVTFLLFRVMAGDIAASNVGPRAPEQEKADWRHRYGYDKPLLVNLHRQLELIDNTTGDHPLAARNPKGSGSNVANALALVLSTPLQEPAAQPATQPAASQPANAPAVEPPHLRLSGRYIYQLSAQTPLSDLTAGLPIIDKPSPKSPAPVPTLEVALSSGDKFVVELSGAATAGDLLQRINSAPGNGGKVTARISDYSLGQAIDSQFFHHLYNSITFESRSFKDNQPLTEIIREKGRYSLAITVPAMALEFMLGLAIAAVVAYYRGRALDKIGVFLSVLGMCIPFLAFMIYGQFLMFKIAPAHAYGIFYRSNIYLPIAIMVLAGIGSMVRFYRTIILDETNRDYVRTARAKGVPLPGILFKHVLKNCMLPILTNLILSIPFLIMGSLLVESYFGIPGLGDLMLTCISNRNEPILNGLVFLTAVIYTAGVLITDLCYALFDPRIRLS